MRLLLVTGSRDWDDPGYIEYTLSTLYAQNRWDRDVFLMTGACPTGADKIAEDWAKMTERPYVGIPAQWKKNDRAAGPIRNKEMAILMPFFCVAFRKGNSPGTKNMLDLVEKWKIPHTIYNLA